ncbi:hypothetical protein D0Y65_040669 [Glycine soja]|uniref:RNase H type-1 domain-containing protein n=1 Tax=Glycine soja TaxID=3848 RepID=A0A445GSA2_GLYSO|nr:hypothetical protein D0Y65_040669 [Glycine soja]
MASKSIACIVLLSLNLLFFTMVSPNTIAPSPAIQPPPPPRECPELGLCLDILGLGQGSPSKDCCPILRGLIEVGAIVCICDKLRKAACADLRGDHFGSFVFAITYNLGFCSVLEAELWAIYHGLKIIRDKAIVVESDSSLAVQMLNDGCSRQHSSYLLANKVVSLVEYSIDGFLDCAANAISGLKVIKILDLGVTTSQCFIWWHHNVGASTQIRVVLILVLILTIARDTVRDKGTTLVGVGANCGGKESEV